VNASDNITSWPDPLESAIEGTFIDRVMVLNETHSTQDAAARACLGLPQDHPPTLVVASHQLMGRGQRASNWYDADGCTLPCSLALGPNHLALNNPNLAARAGLAALDAVKHFIPNQPVAIKWPNDIMVAMEGVGGIQKKIAGVLIEHAANSVVIGIGINCTQSKNDFHPDIQDTAVSLHQLGSQNRRIDLACELITSLHHWFVDADETQIRQHWKQHDALVGSTCKLVHNNQPHTGKVIAIDPLNDIRLQTTDGEINLPVEQTRLIQ